MKKTYAILFVGLTLFLSSFYTGCRSHIVWVVIAELKTAETPKTDKFETAVEIIKKYETLHKAKHWPLVGYGHKVMPGEKFSRGRVLSEKEADALLRKDLKKLCAIFRPFGKDSLLLATLAYNIGHGAVNRSSIVTRLKAGDRNIEDIYISHCRYRGKQHAAIKRRRIEEFENLYIADNAVAEQKQVTPLFLRPILSDSKSPLAQLFALATMPEEKSTSANLKLTKAS